MPRNPDKPLDCSHIDELVAHFQDERHRFEILADSLVTTVQKSPDLFPLLHSVRHRIKEPNHLRNKLLRFEERCKQDGKPFGINVGNLFRKVNDLAGIRLLHLHTEQVGDINRRLLAILKEQMYQIVEGPVANCWDVEYEELFKRFEIPTKSRNSMYTTVHYVVQANRRTKITCEIQVRTLMDEVWGEVSHRVNYPRESISRSCRDQLRVLARVTTAGTRLVDSIFMSHEEAPKTVRGAPRNRRRRSVGPVN